MMEEDWTAGVDTLDDLCVEMISDGFGKKFKVTGENPKTAVVNLRVAQVLDEVESMTYQKF